MPLGTAGRVVQTGWSDLPLDEDGFILQPQQWNREIAQQLAHDIGLGQLDSTQWRIIDYVRDRYLRIGGLPPMRSLCRRLGVERSAVKATFGGCRPLWQIAGLPNPGPEALAYLD